MYRCAAVRRDQGFTLIELIVSIAIVVVLAAILFPVFIQAKEAARASVCLSNFRQVTFSMFLYQADYDDSYSLAKYSANDDATSAQDHTWVQLVLPYSREFRLFRCPSDYSGWPESQAVFDEDVVPGDTYSRYYTASKRTNLGFNYLYLAPLVNRGGRVSAVSRTQSDVGDPANMLMFGDSVHEVDSAGHPHGGGSYLIIPPCRYATTGHLRDDTFMLNVPDSALYKPGLEWGSSDGQVANVPTSAGGLWPWHSEKLTAAFSDGHTRRISIAQAVDGCNVKPDWQGYVYDRARYIWDLQ
ncbi:MAG TPA: type II secretion system protein [Fimbriimonadaceae bacterium]|nr:type II secretion system protein [Fimbriimonadaceae bacterium]